MQQNDQYNQVTVDWYRGNIDLDPDQVAPYSADPADIETFRRDGAVILRGLFKDWVEPLRAGFQRNLDNPQAYAFPCESNPAGQPGRFFDSYCNWQLIPEYLDYVRYSCAASLAGQFMQADSARLFHDHAFMKTPGTQCATPWHQDMPYYCVDGLQTASVYVSLDHAAEDVAVRFVKGSHRRERLFNPRIFEDGSSFYSDQPDADFAPVPDIEARPEDYDILASALEPGDTIVFDFRTLHGTGDAEVKSIRRAFSTRWLGDDVTFCERPGETSPPYHGHGMRHGEPMRDDWFPVLWRRG